MLKNIPFYTKIFPGKRNVLLVKVKGGLIHDPIISGQVRKLKWVGMVRNKNEL